MPTVFWFSKLQPGMSAATYEAWVREVDYVQARQIPSILSYRVHRINGAYAGGTVAYDYLEVVEVTDVEAYRQDIAQHPAAQKIVAEIGQYVQSVGSAWGNEIE